MKEKELPFHIQEAIHNYEPIETEGLRLYPIRVKEYQQFTMARSAIEVLQTSFPVAYLSMPLLQAYYQMDLIEPTVSGSEPTGLFGRAILLLSLALRLGEGKKAEERILRFAPVVNPSDPRRLKSVRAVGNDGGAIDVTPVQFQRLRPIIAAQNGVELESDNADPDLVKAERDLAEMKGVNLDVSVWQMKSSVAALTGADEAEMGEWALRKLTDRADSLKRAIDYVVCGIGGSFGGWGKGGNPVPHPFYEKIKTGFSAVIPLEDYANGAGARAAQNPGQKTI